MAWCPVCKNEYVEGITKCADCGAELVDELTEESSSDAVETEEFLQSPEYHEGRAAYINSTTPYQDSEQKAADFKSSAFVLLAVGIIGLTGLIVMCSRIIPFERMGLSALSTTFQPFSIGTLAMGALFVIFIVTGISSMKSAKTYKERAVEEKSLREEITAWCRNTLIREHEEREEEISDEELYFRRMERMKEAVLDKYPDSEEGLVESILDELYPEIYGE